jgi:hypothetical protein
MAPKRLKSPQSENPRSKRREIQNASSPASHWSHKDQIILEATSLREETLWRRAFDIFGKPPHKLLPANEHVNVDKNGLIKHPDFSMGIKNTNWTVGVCETFTTLILSSEFTGRPQYLRQCIHHAICYRKGLPAPGFTLDDDVETDPHFECLEYLKDEVNNMRWSDTGDGVVLRDLTAIRGGWNRYVDERNDPTLEKMETSQKKYRKKLGKPGRNSYLMPREEILGKKKKWILSSRVEIDEDDDEQYGDEFETVFQKNFGNLSII